jgi:hypothetical protein
MARNCVTHHMCDCTAERIKELEAERKAGNDAWHEQEDRLKELEGKLDSETNRANHEERLRRTAETCAGSMSKSLEDEIRNNAALALEADHQRKCAKEWFDRMQAAECRLNSALDLMKKFEDALEARRIDYPRALERVREFLAGSVAACPQCGLLEGHTRICPTLVERRDGK